MAMRCFCFYQQAAAMAAEGHTHILFFFIAMNLHHSDVHHPKCAHRLECNCGVHCHCGCLLASSCHQHRLRVVHGRLCRWRTGHLCRNSTQWGSHVSILYPLLLIPPLICPYLCICPYPAPAPTPTPIFTPALPLHLPLPLPLNLPVLLPYPYHHPCIRRYLYPYPCSYSTPTDSAFPFVFLCQHAC